MLSFFDKLLERAEEIFCPLFLFDVKRSVFVEGIVCSFFIKSFRVWDSGKGYSCAELSSGERILVLFFE